VGDAGAALSPGLLQKYEGRVLLVLAGTCAVNCRYCFRREFPYGETPRGVEAWRPAIEQIAADASIREVILSGGDPLVLGDAALERLAHELAAVPHLARLRVHTRLPIVIPERVTDELIGWLRGTRLAPVFVVHANHSAELDEACGAALGRLVDGGVPVLNQSVLLRGVNDDPDALMRLSERLLELRVLPYYLHQLDRVRGSAHFHVSEERGREIVDEMRRRLPGYAVPRYVRETPGSASKEPV
jgi:EF-P beta-lysylation protein EpmB